MLIRRPSVSMNPGTTTLSYRFLHFLLLILLGLSQSSVGFSQELKDQKVKPFSRALIINGDNLNFGLFWGVLQALKDQGREPDLIIANCGASIAAAITKVHSNGPEEWKQAFESQELFEQLRAITIRKNIFKKFAAEFYRAQINARREWEGGIQFPNLFGFHLLASIEIEKLKDLNIPFSSEGPRLIMMSSRIDFEPTQSARKVKRGDKFFTETYFTDADTARYLEGRRSWTAKNFPDSYIKLDTDIVTGATLAQAVRATIADPFLMLPAKIEGDHYVSASYDLDPTHLAVELADEVIALHKTGWDPVLQWPVLKVAYQVDVDAAQEKAMNQPDVDIWIDWTAMPKKLPSMEPSIKVNLFDSNNWIYSENSVPQEYKDYLKIIEAQRKFGYERAKEALDQEPKSKAHFRKPFKRRAIFFKPLAGQKAMKIKRLELIKNHIKRIRDRYRNNCLRIFKKFKL